MKNWFNANERTLHIILAYAQGTSQTLAESDAVNSEERKWLRTIATYIEKFNQSVLDRLGFPYARTLKNTLDINELRLKSKLARNNEEALSMASVEDLQDKLSTRCMLNCLGCKREDWKDCSV